MKLTLGGDVMIGRSFNQLFDENPDFNIWGNLLPHLEETNLFAINLETTLTDSTNKWPDKAFNYKLSPRYASVLSQGRVDYCSLANNHILDYQVEGLVDTIETLDQLGITHAGAGLNLEEAQTPTILEGIGFLSAADHYDYWTATSSQPGIWYLDIDKGDYGSALDAVRKLRPLVDTIVFSLHWGPNWSQEVSPARKRFAYDLVREGVDIIHGHSSHHVQPIEMIGNSVVFYGIGDLIDDYVVDEDYRSNLSFLADVHLNNGHVSDIEILPTKIHNMQVNFAEGGDADFVHEKALNE